MHDHWHDNRRMNDEAHNVLVTDFPSGTAIRRFWLAWLVLMLAILVCLIVTILIASIDADPGRVSPVG
jgi:hypothetical protein